ncbi:hypothetical protein [Pseudomonas abyssi]|uniref:hypothetical protein n=1 Tax=Pseudomonas abyssi TaxID=170540 RepID=UPI0011C11391|nr:hypothetical protein [Halopseudomonas gallaeciensis]
MDVLTNLAVSITSGAIAAFLGAWWAIRKFYVERNWERRERAYEEIIHALYDITRYCAVQKENYGQGTGLSAEKEHELQVKYMSAYSSVNKSIDIGSLYISSKANEILQLLRERRNVDYEGEPAFEVFEHEHSIHKESLESFLIVARKELHVK